MMGLELLLTIQYLKGTFEHAIAKALVFPVECGVPFGLRLHFSEQRVLLQCWIFELAAGLVLMLILTIIQSCELRNRTTMSQGGKHTMLRLSPFCVEFDVFLLMCGLFKNL